MLGNLRFFLGSSEHLAHHASSSLTLLKVRSAFYVVLPVNGLRLANTSKGSLMQVHAKMGPINDRNGMDLTEAEDIKKKWQEYTELYKKIFMTHDDQDGVITDLEPDILECEVKWALESITTNKASGGDGIPVEIFQILKDDAVKVLHSICQQIWKTQQWPMRNPEVGDYWHSLSSLTAAGLMSLCFLALHLMAPRWLL